MRCTYNNLRRTEDEVEIKEINERNKTQFRKQSTKLKWQTMEQNYDAFPEHRRERKVSENNRRI